MTNRGLESFILVTNINHLGKIYIQEVNMEKSLRSYKVVCLYTHTRQGNESSIRA